MDYAFPALVSYWTDPRGSFIGELKRTCDTFGIGLNLFIDSGAYSAFTSGKPIQIEDYAKYLEKHKDIATLYANLDVIGGTIEQNDVNQTYLEERGFNPTPVHHFGESMEWLQELSRRKYNKIALGGLVGVKKWLQMVYLRACADILKREESPPLIHVFGMSPTPELIEIYPWDSFDSSSVFGARFNQFTGPYGNRLKMSDLKGIRTKNILIKSIIDEMCLSPRTIELIQRIKKPTRGYGSPAFWNSLGIMTSAKNYQHIINTTGIKATYYPVFTTLKAPYLDMLISGTKDYYENRAAPC